MKSSTWHAEEALLLLMSGGFFIHLISASRHLRDDRAQVGDVLLWPVDMALFVLMAYCSLALISRSGHFALTYDLTSTPRKVGYWAITAYVTVSLPGHVLFLLTGDTRFFDGFPWWFSVAILPVYAVVVAYVVTLRPRPAPEPAAATESSRAGRPVAEQRRAPARSGAGS
jgi:hypothetical protein